MPVIELKGLILADPAEVPHEQIGGQELTLSPEMGASALPVKDQGKPPTHP